MHSHHLYFKYKAFFFALKFIL